MTDISNLFLPQTGPVPPARPTLYNVAPDLAGLLEQGNLDLLSRPVVKNPDGSISTVRSMSIGQDGYEVLIPTVSKNGNLLSDDGAIALYERTGEHLGKFASPSIADLYAEKLHEQQMKFYGRR